MRRAAGIALCALTLAALSAAGKAVDVKIYPGAGHAFANVNNWKGYREDAAKDAWKRSVDFLARHLKRG